MTPSSQRGRIEAGVWDIPLADYVADPCVEPSLSASIAKVLVNPTKTPAHAKLLHPRFTAQPVREFNAVPNFGSAVHALAFGGPKVVALDYKDWRKDDAQKERAAVLAAGDVPLLAKDMARAQKCCGAALLALYTLDIAWAFEKTLVWKASGVWHRCRPDAHHMMRIIVDLKVTQTDPPDANRQFFNQDEDMQAAFVEAGCDALDPGGRGRRKIFYLYVEDDEPFVARMLPVSEATLTIARKRRIAATNIWRQCITANKWPTGSLMLPPSERPNRNEAAWLAREINEPHLVEEMEDERAST